MNYKPTRGVNVDEASSPAVGVCGGGLGGQSAPEVEKIVIFQNEKKNGAFVKRF